MSKKKDLHKNLKNRFKNLIYKYKVKFLIKKYKNEKIDTEKKQYFHSIESCLYKGLKFNIFSKSQIKKKLKFLKSI